ncbi:uncharacterized protein LOC134272783 [Saccostrea cucullata]|uniref:uncharacterized protein LOC134272783 n=1 Tax=Saccostrea cuccullata TaxID=36930 RepID=UPI002ED25DED
MGEELEKTAFPPPNIPSPPSPSYHSTLQLIGATTPVVNESENSSLSVPFQRPLTPIPESELNFHGSYAPAVESPNSYSPADDSNYPPTLNSGLVIDEEPLSFRDVEDSVLTTYGNKLIPFFLLLFK